MSRRCVIAACVFFAGAMPVNSFAAPGDFIDVFVSSPPEELDWASAVTFGPDGNLYVAGRLGPTVARYDGTTGDFIDDFVGGWAPPIPAGFVFAPDGYLYVGGLNDIGRFDPQTGELIEVFVRDGPNLEYVRHMAVGPDGHLYVASQGTDLVVSYSLETGEEIDTFSPGVEPVGLEFGSDGLLYVTAAPENGGPAYITRIDINTRQVLGPFATGPGPFMRGLRFGPCSDIYAADFYRGVVVRFDARTGEYLGDFTSSHLQYPEDLTFGPDGNLYVTSMYVDHDEVVRFRGWDPNCGIPAIGAWEAVVMALGLAAVGTIRLRRDGRVRLGARVVKGRTSCHEDA